MEMCLMRNVKFINVEQQKMDRFNIPSDNNGTPDTFREQNLDNFKYQNALLPRSTWGIRQGAE